MKDAELAAAAQRERYSRRKHDARFLANHEFVIEPGVELVSGVHQDAAFGPVVMVGLGGILVEVLKDVSFRIVPIEKADAIAMTGEIQGRKLLEGYRGQDPADIARLQDMLVKLSDFVDRTPGIEEIDMNPVFAYRDGAVVVDARIILSPDGQAER